MVDIHWRKFLKKGDQHSFGFIYNHCVDDLFSYGISLGYHKETCQDAIQDTFYKLCISRVKLHHVENVIAYLFKIYKHFLIDSGKKERREESIESLFDSFTIHVTVLDEIIRNENSEWLQRKVESLLNKLTANQKEIVYLKYTVGLQHREIAEVLGINEDSARKLLYRAMEKLRKYAAEENISEKLLLVILLSML